MKTVKPGASKSVHTVWIQGGGPSGSAQEAGVVAETDCDVPMRPGDTFFCNGVYEVLHSQIEVNARETTRRNIVVRK